MGLGGGYELEEASTRSRNSREPCLDHRDFASSETGDRSKVDSLGGFILGLTFLPTGCSWLYSFFSLPLK